MAERKPICQYCLADPRYTHIGVDRATRCPVCGAPYSGPRRDAEFQALVGAGLVSDEEDRLRAADACIAVDDDLEDGCG